MARLLALEWDAHEARLAVAQTSGKGIVLEQALAIDLRSRDSEEVNVGERLAAAMAAHSIGRGETLVAVGRANIELRLLSVPPAPEDELPEIVRFQAMRQFSSIGDDWPLDYCPLSVSDDESINVLAAAISPELVDQIRETLQVGGLTPQRIVLRAFAAASLLISRDSSHDCQMMVDLLTDEADLTVLVDRQVVFIRTVRVPSAEQGDAQTSALLGEIRRTLIAAQNQLGGRRVQRVAVCGDEATHVALKQRLEEELSLPVELFDPFAEFQLEAKLESHRPDNPGRFAPLLGMLADAASGNQHSIDFLHPRQKTPPPNPLRRMSAGLIAITAVVLIAGGVIWAQLHSKKQTIKQLAARSAELDAVVTEAKKQQAKLAEIEIFTSGQVPWLDELRELSLDLPPAEDAIVTQLLMLSQPEGGKIILDGYVTESATIDSLESALRDPRHTVRGSGGKEDKSKATYRWQFAETIGVRLPDDVPSDESAETSSPSSGDDVAGALKVGSVKPGGMRP